MRINAHHHHTQSSWSSPITYIIWILGPLQVPLLDHNNQTVTRDTTPPPGKRTLRSKLWVKFENKQHRNENKRQPRWMAFECAYPHEEVRVHYSYYIHTVCNPDVKGASLGPLHHPLNHHHHHHRHHRITSREICSSHCNRSSRWCPLRMSCV